jgi:hypothetical protein
MELVIIAGFAVVAIYLLSRGSGVPVIPLNTAPPVIGSYPEYQPLRPSFNSQPSAASTEGAITGAAAQGALQAAGQIPVVGAAIQAIGAQLLAQHQARLKGATNENNAALTIVPAFDDFVSRLVAAYKSGQLSASQTAGYLQSFDQSMYQQLRSLVGPPGTAWSDANGMAGKCDKTCTVSCCLYYSDLGPPLSLMRCILGDQSGQWGASDPRINLNARTVQVPRVYPGKYSNYSRAGYTVQL